MGTEGGADRRSHLDAPRCRAVAGIWLTASSISRMRVTATTTTSVTSASRNRPEARPPARRGLTCDSSPFTKLRPSHRAAGPAAALLLQVRHSPKRERRPRGRSAAKQQRVLAGPRYTRTRSDSRDCASLVGWPRVGARGVGAGRPGARDLRGAAAGRVHTGSHAERQEFLCNLLAKRHSRSRRS
jgi:hypothetical protein